MTLLSANLNKVALLRNTRTIGIPSVERAAHLVLDAGAHGVTVHPRPDGRHVRANDVRELAAILRERPGTEFNIEGNPFHRSEEHTSELQSRLHLVCRLLLEKKKTKHTAMRPLPRRHVCLLERSTC